MKIIYPFLYIIILITCISKQDALAQNFEIRGVVWEPKIQESLPFAQIALFLLDSKLPIDGTLTDELGQFNLNVNSSSSYRLQIQFLGYQTYSTIITVDKQLLDLGKIELLLSAQNLQEIVVTAEKKAIGNENGNWVLYPDKLTNGGTDSTIDLLSNLPSVSLDMDERAVIRGREATILIDGVKADDISELDQITPSSIAKIEVIQNPSAKYDAEGSVINITLKAPIQSKSFTKLKTGADHLGNHQENIYISSKHKNWGGFVLASNKFNNFESTNNLERNNKMADQTPVIMQYKDQCSEKKQKQIRLGINYGFSPNHLTKLMTQWQNNKSQPLTNTRKENRDNSNELTKFSNQHQTSESNKIIKLLRTQYIGKWDKQTLKFQFNYRQVDQQNDQLFESLNYSHEGTSLSTYPYQKQDDIALYEEKTQGTIDFEQKWNKKTNMELGVDASLDKYRQNSIQEKYKHDENNWISVPSKTFLYDFEKRTAAIYGIINHQHNKWFVSAGARVRHITYITNNSRDNEIAKDDNSYLTVLPTVKIGHNWQKSDLSFSYKKSQKLPASYQLNSYRNDANPLNIQYGNPNLKPEKEHSISLEYSLNNKKYQMGFALYHRFIDDVIMADYSSKGDTLFRTLGNLGKQKLMGFEYTLSYKATEWCRFNGSGSIYHQKFSGEALSLVQKQMWSYNCKLSSTVKLTKQTRFQIDYSWQSGTINKNGLQGKLYNLDLSINKQYFKKRLKVSLKAANILDSKSRWYKVENMQFTSNRSRYQNTRRIMLGLVYKWSHAKA